MKGEISEINEEKALLSSKTLYDNRINQRSEMAQEIISHKQGFFEKWALLIFFLILILALSGTWAIKYPDIIEVRATLTAANAPKEIMSIQEGRLVKLFVQNNQMVNKYEILGWIESTANHEEVIGLSNQIDSIVSLMNSQHIEKVSELFNKDYSNLGEIQPGYQQFITAWQLCNDYQVNGFYSRKKNMLQSDILSLKKTRQTILIHKKLVGQDIKLAEETYKMNKLLENENVISRYELRVETSKFVNKQMAIPQLDESLLSNETQINDKLKELDQLDHDLAQQKVIFQQALQSLKSSVDDWKKKYLLRSPIEGRVLFIIPLQENQFLQQGKLLGYVTPDNSHFYVEANLAQTNFGKIDTGLKVQLRFDAYPYQEVGFVRGTINYVSNIPSDSGFLTTIRLDNGLLTNNQKCITYKSGLKAQAIIITKNMRLLERIYYSMTKFTSTGKKSKA